MDNIQLTADTDRIILDSETNYSIVIEKGPYLILTMGFSANKAAAKYTHKNIFSTYKTIHEYKRESGNRKYWVSKAGIDHILIIPKECVSIIPEAGYSYVKVIINGAQITLNVSGGSSNNGWNDHISTKCSTVINHKLADLKKITEVAIKNSPLGSFPDINKNNPDGNISEDKWNELNAKSYTKLKEQIGKIIENGGNPVIHLIDTLNYENAKSGHGIEVARRKKRVKIDETHWQYGNIGAMKHIVFTTNGRNRVRAKINQINWDKTFKENNLTLV